MKRNIVTIIILLFSLSLFGQGTINKRLKEIKGGIKSITIATDSGTVEFTGKDAAKLIKRLKHPGPQIISLRTDADFDDIDGDSLDLKIKILGDSAACRNLSFVCPDIDIPDIDLPDIDVPECDFNLPDCDFNIPCPPPCHFRIYGDADTLLKHKDFKCWKEFLNDSAMKQLEGKLKHSFNSDSLRHNLQKCSKLLKLNMDKLHKGMQIFGDHTKVVVITKENGKATTKTYVGKEAEKKLKELDAQDSDKTAGQKKVIIKKKEIKVQSDAKKDTEKTPKNKNDK